VYIEIDVETNTFQFAQDKWEFPQQEGLGKLTAIEV
jgi:hypothetical protein